MFPKKEELYNAHHVCYKFYLLVEYLEKTRNVSMGTTQHVSTVSLGWHIGCQILKAFLLFFTIIVDLVILCEKNEGLPAEVLFLQALLL